MEWLMGKARGVSRGLLSTTPTATSPSEQIPTIASAFSQQISPDSLHQINEKECITRVNHNHVHYRPTQPKVAVTNQESENKVSHSLPPVCLSSEASKLSSLVEENQTKYKFLQPSYIQQQLPCATASAVDFPSLILPFPFVEVNEWIAAHTIGLFENLSTIYDAICELCVCKILNTWSTCDYRMRSQVNESSDSPLSHIELIKSDISKITKKDYSARQAITILLSECNDIIQSSRIFPIKPGQPFPSDLRLESGKICQRLLLCLSHVYVAHFHHLEQLDLIAHMNTLAKHFFAFITEFNIVKINDLDPMKDFYKTLLSTPAPNVQTKCPTKTEVLESDLVSSIADQL